MIPNLEERIIQIEDALGLKALLSNTTPIASAYELALLWGYVGSEEEWLDSLKGEKGDKGDPGAGIPGPEGPPGTSDYNDLTNIPATFAPSAHAHAPAEVTGTAVVTNDSRLSDARAPLGHAHAIGDTTGLQTAIDGKAATAHAHTPSEVTGTAVTTNDARLSDARVPLAHGHAIADVTNLQSGLDGKEAANANIQTHVVSAHAPSDAQKNSDITKAEIEAKLTGELASHSHAGGAQAFPIGSVFISVVDTNPGTLLGYGTWAAFAAGRMLIGLNGADTDFDTAEETGGAKTVTLDTTMIPAHGHTQDAHTHTQNSHNHIQDAHTHTQNSHNHTQDPHTHTLTGGATDDTSAPFPGPDAANASTVFATTGIQAATATNQATTPTNQNATPTNQAATAVNQNATATNQNTGGGLAHNNMPPYIVVYMWKRTV